MEINIKEMSATKWRKLKDELELQLKTVDGYKNCRISRTEPTVICIAHCGVPIHFDIRTGVMSIWNKCSKYSGGYRSMDTLRKIEYILQTWAVNNFPVGV